MSVILRRRSVLVIGCDAQRRTLTDMLAGQMHRITTACVVECERQDVDLVGLSGLVLAYNYALTESARGKPTLDAVLRMGQYVEPTVNAQGWRRTPVTFADGGAALPASQIGHAMSRWGELIEDAAPELALEVVQEFLTIHPFSDGNGRVAFLLHNWLIESLLDPRPLPDFDF